MYIMTLQTTEKESDNKYYRLRDDKLIFFDRYKNKIGNITLKWCDIISSITSCFLIVLITAAAFVGLYHIYWHRETKLILVHHVQEDSTDYFQVNLSSPPKVISCYYNFPNEHGTEELMPTDIHPNLCTHINVAFARVVNKEIKLENYQYEVLLDIVKLKSKNPDLKILLSVGGAKNDDGFPNMVIDHKSRKIFIKSIKNLLKNYTLDGIDLDWEFPALHNMEGGHRERQHFSQLLREIRMEFIREKRDYILTIAAAAPETIVDISYDIEQLNQYLDFVNIMTYDFHYYTKYTPFTGFNAPLYQRSTEQLYLATLNINYTVNMYIGKGLDPNKIVVGIPTYGHTFALVNANNHRVSSPASGFGSLGSSGFINYPDVCTYVKNASDVTISVDNEAKVPYLYKDKNWVSYEDQQSVMEKAKFIIENQLRGAMIYSLNADDFAGVCCGGLPCTGRFPLSITVRDTLKDYLNTTVGVV